VTLIGQGPAATTAAGGAGTAVTVNAPGATVTLPDFAVTSTGGGTVRGRVVVTNLASNTPPAASASTWPPGRGAPRSAGRSPPTA
jgi:hypothetical protein